MPGTITTGTSRLAILIACPPLPSGTGSRLLEPVAHAQVVAPAIAVVLVEVAGDRHVRDARFVGQVRRLQRERQVVVHAPGGAEVDRAAAFDVAVLRGR